MFINNIDILSPSISLFYYGNRRHPTILGAILTLLLIIISIVYIVFLILNIINHEISTYMFYRSYFKDIGNYYFNDSTGIFHYFQIYDTKENKYGEFNHKYIRIFMSRQYKSYQNNQGNLSENEHWVYDLCRKDIDNKNIDKDLFYNKNNSFISSACLRYYYDNKNHIYFPIEDKENFKYPYLIHGKENNENLYLETIVEKCENSSVTSEILGHCGNQEEIDEYFEKYKGIYLQILVTQAEIDKYHNPINQYLYGIGGSLDASSVPVNNINLIPFNIEIKKGIFIPKIKKTITYSLDNNRRATWENKNNKKILAIFYYWMETTGQVIKGGYLTILDILPRIGGFIQLIYFIFFCLNYLYNKYITIFDFNEIFFRMCNEEDPKDVHIKKIFFDDAYSLREEIFTEQMKNIDATGKRDSIYITKMARLKKNVKENNQSINENHEENKNNLSNSNDLISSSIAHNKNLISNNVTVVKKKKNNYDSNKSLFNNNKVVDINNMTFKETEKICNHFTFHLKEYINQKKREFKFESLNSQITSRFINFFYYLMSILKNQDKKRIFYVLSQFRKKLISEEHIYRTDIILYHLEKYFDIKEEQKIDIVDLYENL